MAAPNREPAMMPTNKPHLPAYLLGDADDDTVDSLVRESRRLGARWPRHHSFEDPAAAPHRALRVTRRSAELIRNMSDYGD
jgi:hypothetical protein